MFSLTKNLLCTIYNRSCFSQESIQENEKKKLIKIKRKKVIGRVIIKKEKQEREVAILSSHRKDGKIPQRKGTIRRRHG